MTYFRFVLRTKCLHVQLELNVLTCVLSLIQIRIQSTNLLLSISQSLTSLLSE